MAERPSVVLVDDHLAVLEAMSARLAAANFEIVQTLESAANLTAACEAHHPNLVLLDISMPGPSPFDAVARIKVASPTTKVLFFSGQSSDQAVDQAIRSGADGYVSKSESFDALLAGVRAVLGGETYWSPSVADRVWRVQGQPPSSRLSTLTPRETEILRYLAQGMNCDDLAKLLGLSRKTVEKHQYHLRDKLKIYSAGELTRFAIREGLIAP